ncbi:transporter substrate-binding domain-containing protein [Pseudohalocynthiibacter aestuariivivens]|nr:transporter substrate-binding domain-containing protein [Pseudohalocynthiibacter aestuariivivens]QIE45993.1 transporter substrate-binding domain-containing protein [Pseudohalocynthiibacter aestuariivivens]
MKIRALLAATATAFVTTAVQADDMVIRWGTEAGYKPFIYKTADGELTGFDYEIGNAICEVLEAECSWTEQDFDGLIPGLLAGKYDAILASLSITEQRKRVVDFTGKYYHVGFVFVGPENAGIESEADLAGKSVGVQRGTVTERYVSSEIPEAEVRAYPTQDEVWLDLAAGRIDAGLAHKLVVEDGFLNTERGKGFQVFGKEHFEQEYFGEGAGIAVRKADVEMRDAISGAIATLRENGTYQEINEKYFAYDIYGE